MLLLTRDKDELISTINKLTDTVHTLKGRVKELEKTSHLYTYRVYSMDRVPMDQVMWLVLDKLGLSLKRHPATPERFTLEDKS